MHYTLTNNSNKMTIQSNVNMIHDNQNPHFVVVPFMAQGHMIPMLDFALLLSSRGTLVTFITTPFNASRVRPTIDTALKNSLPIRFIELPFPCQEVGLPESCENLDIVPPELITNFFDALCLLSKPLQNYLQLQTPFPTCMVTDLCQPWTVEVSTNLHIPRLTFYSICCFTLLCAHNINLYKIRETVKDDHEPFVVPALTKGTEIKVTKDQAKVFFTESGWPDFGKRVDDAELASDGYVVNTFDELEVEHVKEYGLAKGKKVWTVGPFSLRNKDAIDMATRGDRAGIDAERCMSWLSSKKEKSVVYVSFGSLTVVMPKQVVEIGAGLERSGAPFVWVVKKHEIMSGEVETWLEKFEKRVGSRGLIIKGWAPQVMILGHEAVGGFVTHCGWNSTLEGVVAGVPMVTWPYFADQFLNERMIVDVLRIGVEIGVKKQYAWGTENEDLLVGRERVEEVVREVMGGEEGGEGRRRRAVELGVRAKKAMEKGGSSYENMTKLVQFYSVD